MKTRLVPAILWIALIALFCFEGKVVAVDPPAPTFPVEYPIGSEGVMLDSAVKNPYTRIYMFYAFKEPGFSQLFGTFGNSFESFASYNAFKAHVKVRALNYKSQIEAWQPQNRPSPQAEAILYVVVWVSQPQTGNYDYDTEEVTLVIEKNLGPFYTVSANSFLELPTSNVRSVSYITNIQQLNIEVQTTAGLYCNEWKASTQSWTNTSGVYPPEKVTRNAAFFNSWYGTGTNRVRIKTKIGPFVREYTQDGQQTVSPTIMLMSSNKVGAYIPKGVDVTFQSSTNMINWVNKNTFSWSLHTNQVWMPDSQPTALPENKPPREFYRAIVR